MLYQVVTIRESILSTGNEKHISDTWSIDVETNGFDHTNLLSSVQIRSGKLPCSCSNLDKKDSFSGGKVKLAIYILNDSTQSQLT